MASDAGTIVGPIIAGLIADGVGFGPAFATGGVVSLVGLLLSALMPETLPSKVEHRPDEAELSEAAHLEVPDAPVTPPASGPPA